MADARESLQHMPTGVRQLARQGAVAQIHAGFEEYIADFMSEWTRARVVGGETVASLPQRLRAWLIHREQTGAYISYFINPDEKKLLERLDITKLPLLLAADDTIPGKIEAAEILKDREYPSFKNLQRLFYRLGIDNLAANLGVILSQNAERYFDSFSTVRTSVAHRTGGPLSFRDVMEFDRRARKIVQMLDYMFFEALCRRTGGKAWP